MSRKRASSNVFLKEKVGRDEATRMYFCPRRSPDHGSVVVVVVVVVLGGTTLVFDFLQDTEIFME